MRLLPLRVSALAAALLLSVGPLSAQPAPAQVEPMPDAEQLEPETVAPTPRDPLEIYADLNLFGEIFDRIRAEYVDPPDEQELVRAAIQGMLTSLDAP